ncbi:SIR2 family protein [Pedobacter sp. MC2016-14]|uniref:SIR2 family protein n=1 Tax=Pedobacter sp. MC2016-14 TaxID=2897327 RepID=UPI001E4FCF6B|nr:SIR2 family protein [Pedobacter sp. MC2016-14]MCD0490593.1 SIR2 family protein [Pedobacter sp. MC2016-14]
MEKTILYGNGLNYLSKDATGWTELLDILMRDDKFDMSFLPNIMTYERIRLNWNKSTDTIHLKSKISDLLKNQPTNEFYGKILNLGVKNFLSTNYDYAINKAWADLTEVNNSSEDLYSIRRNTSLLKDGKEIAKIWNIHGEIRQPKSIMLGLNHYCGSIGKINGYLKGTYDFRDKGQKQDILSIDDKLKSNTFDKYSWIELFFNTNVHIAGFGLDFSEIDLWWILNKRARLKEDNLVKNKVFYYTKPIEEVTKEVDVEMRRREMLEAFDVTIYTISTKEGYEHQWNNIIEHIKSS